MMGGKQFLFLILFLLTAGRVSAQDTLVRGSITYLTMDAVYTSLGRNAGVEDSTILIVTGKPDTIAVLKVFAASSKSSVCRILHSIRPLRIGDVVEGSLPKREIHRDVAVSPGRADTLPQLPSLPASGDNSVRRVPERSLMRVTGRVSLQYLRTMQPTLGRTFTQPGLVLDLHGIASGLPIRFDFYGNFRSSFFGKQIFFSPNQTNRSRIYRISAEYDDSTGRITLGRFVPPGAITTGYVDGLMLSRTMGVVTIGTAGGFEPSFNQQGLSTDMRKFAFFTLINTNDFFSLSANLSYTRRYYHTTIDREVVSSGLTAAPLNDLFITFQSDIDLREPVDGEFRLHPVLSSLVAMVTGQIIREVSVGAGVTAWRPVYSCSSIAGLADSLLDRRLQTSPTLSLTLMLPRGISVFNSYSPRSSLDGFGHEYSTTSSLSAWNFGGSGMNMRGTFTFNSTAYAILRGYSGSLGTSFRRYGEVSLRFQEYHYDLRKIETAYTSHTLALDAFLPITSLLSLSGSVEKMSGPGMDGVNIFTELTCRW